MRSYSAGNQTPDARALLFSQSAWQTTESRDGKKLNIWVGIETVLVSVLEPGFDPAEVDVSVLGRLLIVRSTDRTLAFSAELPCTVRPYGARVVEDAKDLYILLKRA